MGEGLSGQFPYLVQAILQILNIGRIDTPGFVGPLCVLIQIIGASLEHDNELAYFHQIQLDTNSIQRHLADLGAHIQNTGILHFQLYPFLVLRGTANFQFFSPFAHWFWFLPSQIKSAIFQKMLDTGDKFPCPAHIAYFRYS